MSMVPASGTSVEVSLLAPVLLMLTSVGRARHNRATPGSRPGQRAPTTARTSTLRSLGCGNEYESAFLVGPSADLDRGRSPWSGTHSPLIRGRKSRMCLRPLVWSDGGPTDPAQ